MILVIREFDDFSRILAAGGYEIVSLPLIETRKLDDLSGLDSIENYDGVFLTSAKAAEIFKANLKIEYHGKVYVLGGRSYEILKDADLNLRYDAAANTAREMLENIAPDELKGRKFLFVRGDKSLRIVPEFLSEMAAVDEAIVYETREIAVAADEIKKLHENFDFAAVCFFSPSAVKSFIKQFGAEILHQTKIATIGKTTAEFLERQNLKTDFVSSKSNAENFAAELIEYLKEDLPTKDTKSTK